MNMPDSYALHCISWVTKTDNQDQPWLISNFLIVVRLATSKNIFLKVVIAGSVMSHLKMNKGKIVNPIPENRAFFAFTQCQKLFLLLQILPLLFERLTSKSAEATHFRRNIRIFKSAFGMAPVRAQFVSRVPGPSKYNPTVTIHGRMYHEIGSFEHATGMLPQFASVYIHDAEHTTLNRKHF